MAPKIKARKVENGYVISCNGKEFLAADKDNAIIVVTELYRSKVAPIKATELINGLDKPETM